MNSSSFSFVGASTLANNRPGVQSARYPYLPWTADGSVQTVLEVAKQFLVAPTHG